MRRTTSSDSPSCRRHTTSLGFRTRCASCSRTCSETASEDDVDAVARWDATAEPSSEISFSPSRVLLQDLTGVPAVVDLAAMRNAIADLGGDPKRINPLIPAELVIDHSVQVDLFASSRRLRAQRRARVRAQPRALRLPALGTAVVRQLQGRAARHRHLPPGQPRVPGAGRRRPRRRRVPGHARRHRLAHDDGQRPRRARLGRRRDRGRGRDARRAALDARPAGRRLQAHRRAPRGRDGDRSRPHRHRAPAPPRRRRQVRRVLRRRPRLAVAGRPRDAREHVAGVRRDVRLLPGRRRDARLPPADRPQRGAGRARRGVLQGEPALARPGRPRDVLAGRRARPRRRRAVARRPAPAAGPRAAARAKRSFLEQLGSFGVDYANGSHDRAVADTFPASDPTTEQQPGGAPEPVADSRRRRRDAAEAATRSGSSSTARSSSSTTAPS